MREQRRSRGAALKAGMALLCTVGIAAAQSPRDEQTFDRIERGRYLTLLADCAACHDDSRSHRPFAGGLAIETPFGIVAAPNITPDRDTGIGAWSDAQFDAALREGRRPDGARLYPAMPYPYYARMSREDVLAIRAYLNTLEPVSHAVVSDQLPFPFNIRAAMRVWDALYFSPGEFKPEPTQSAAWNRGAYLVEGPGHCGACHTPKTALGGDKSEQRLQGYSIQGWFAPNITDDPRQGLANWSIADIVEYLKTGHNRFAGASGPMGEEVSDSSSQMRREDLEAIATYLKDQRGQAVSAKPLSAHDPIMAAGGAIYQDLCSACHKSDGSGVPHLIPDLAGNASVASREPTTLIRVVLQGAQSVATQEEPTGPAMPAFGWQLTDAQVAAVATFISNTWNHAAPAVSENQVRAARGQLAAGTR